MCAPEEKGDVATFLIQGLNWEGWLPPSIVATSRDSGDSRLCCLGESGISVHRR